MPLTPTPSRVLSQSVISDGAPCDAKCMVPESRPSFITLGPATFTQFTFTSTPARLAVFSTSPACSISISGRKLTPYCCATVISPTSAAAGAAKATSAPTPSTDHILIAFSPGAVCPARHILTASNPRRAGPCKRVGSTLADRRRHDALRHDVDQGGFAAGEGAFDGVRQVGGPFDEFAMSPERHRDLVIARR